MEFDVCFTAKTTAKLTAMPGELEEPLSTPHNVENTKVTFRIPVLAILRSAQQQHGLRHGDYQRYQQFITRKLRRMRKSLHFQQGTRTKVIAKKLTVDMITDPRFIVVKVLEIERSWAYAMQLKSESNTELRKRFHMFSRLKKAVLRAKVLSDLLTEFHLCDTQTQLEVQAYVQWIRGILCFESQDWLNAKEMLEATQKIYTGLAQTVEEESRSVYTARVEELWPQIRYCAYNIGDETAASDLHRMRHHMAVDGSEMLLAESQLDHLLTQARASQANSMTDVKWLGVRIPVKSEKARMAILAVEDSKAELQKLDTAQAKLSLYESLLKSCVEAIAVTREEIRAMAAANANATGDSAAAAAVLATTATSKARVPIGTAVTGSEKMGRIQLLHTYLQFLKLKKTVERNLLHIDIALSSCPADQLKDAVVLSSGYAKPQELARLYDTLVQNLQEVGSLPGVLQDHEGLKDLLLAKVSAYRSFRCYYLALAYAQGRKFAECSALLDRCQEHARQALKSFSPELATWTETEAFTCPGPAVNVLVSQLQTLIRQAEAEDLTCRAGRMLEMATSAGADALEDDGKITPASLQKPLIDRLDVFLDEKNAERCLTTLSQPFVQFPSDFEPVMVKPIFFDLALNYIQFPSLDEKLGSKNPTSTTRVGKAGLTGLMRGWLWGSGSEQNSTK